MICFARYLSELSPSSPSSPSSLSPPLASDHSIADRSECTKDRNQGPGSSAPHHLRLTGWLSDPTHDKAAVSVDLGTYLYVLPTTEEEEVQTFPLRDVKGERHPLKAVTVSVLSNHGATYTTMCRVRVLGELAV